MTARLPTGSALLLADPNESEAEANIAIAKTAGFISEDVLLADYKLRKASAGRKSTPSRISKKRVAETPTNISVQTSVKKPSMKRFP